MPELPEVQTISQQLQKTIAGKKIKSVEVFLPKIIKTPRRELEKAVTGSKIKKIWRRAKMLIFDLTGDWSLVMHLKMTGQLIFNGVTSKHTHIIFHFKDKTHLLFNDLRQFGYIKLIKTDNIPDFFAKNKIGPEPLKNNFTLQNLIGLIHRQPKAKIKKFLMDPSRIAGIGNIYSDEILFFARTHPLRTNGSLKPEEIKRIYQGIKKILPLAIKLRGTSADTYLDAFGQEGKFLKRLKVYGREGQNCVKCRGAVQRIKINGRSAHFCGACQK